MSRMSRLSILAILGAFSASALAQVDEATYWNRVALDAIKLAKTPPPLAARNLAMTSLAQSDAVNSIGGVGVSYAYSGTGSTIGASKEAAVAAAAYNTLKELFPTQRTMLDAAWNQRLPILGSSANVTNGLRLGSESASAMLSFRSTDGASSAAYTYTGSNDVGKWRPTDNGLNGALPGWGNVQGFALTSGSQFRPTISAGLTTQAYADAYNEVKMYGAKNSAVRTADQTEIALFWSANGGSVTPPGMWNEVAAKVANQRGISIDEKVRMFGTLNMALADAGIAAWDIKYTDSIWRPESAIRNGALDGNSQTEADATWTGLMTTPNHPSCVSGHSTFSAAGATVLASMFGNDTAFSFSSDSLAGVSRSFNSFSQAAAEAGQSRIYGGIHFQFDNTYGLELGGKVGSTAVSRMTPVPEPASMIALGAGALALLRRRKKAAK
jgi:hypothetical protein